MRVGAKDAGADPLALWSWIGRLWRAQENRGWVNGEFCLQRVCPQVKG